MTSTVASLQIVIFLACSGASSIHKDAPGLAKWLSRVEEARYQFGLNRTDAFAVAYPRELFETQALFSTKKECVLLRRYGKGVSEAALVAEAARIEAKTQAPEVWDSVKKALNNDPALIRAVICRPLIVDRELRDSFSGDHALHRAALTEITTLRNRLLRGSRAVGRAAFTNVPVCVPSHAPSDIAEECHGIGGTVAVEMLRSFQRDEAVTPIVEDSEFFYVARVRRKDRLVADGFAAKKRDYMEWLRATSCDAQRRPTF